MNGAGSLRQSALTSLASPSSPLPRMLVVGAAACYWTRLHPAGREANRMVPLSQRGWGSGEGMLTLCTPPGALRAKLSEGAFVYLFLYFLPL